MSMTAIEGEVRAYLSALRAHLKDLPEEERDDLLEDLEQHLTEVRAEGEGSLIERLGPPDVYAAELRASVGITPAKTTWTSRLRSTQERALQNIRAFMPELRPGWWVLRGAIAVSAPVAIAMNRDLSDYLPPNAGTIPGLLLVGVGIWFSVKLGRRAMESAGARLWTIAVNAAVVLVAFIATVNLNSAHENLVNQMVANEEVSQPFGYLAHGDGTPIANICPYDKHGKPLKSVLLFDESGRPITEVAPAYNGPESEAQANPPAPAFQNSFPLKRKIFDPNTNEAQTLHCPKVIVTSQAP